jgi:hypothetical protein
MRGDKILHTLGSVLAASPRLSSLLSLRRPRALPLVMLTRHDVPRNVLRALVEEPFMAGAFHSDPRLTFPTYEAVVAAPMWGARVLEKLDGGQYARVGELYADIQLIFDNAILFNSKDPVWANEVRFEFFNLHVSISAAFKSPFLDLENIHHDFSLLFTPNRLSHVFPPAPGPLSQILLRHAPATRVAADAVGARRGARALPQQ